MAKPVKLIGIPFSKKEIRDLNQATHRLAIEYMTYAMLLDEKRHLWETAEAAKVRQAFSISLNKMSGEYMKAVWHAANVFAIKSRDVLPRTLYSADMEFDNPLYQIKKKHLLKEWTGLENNLANGWRNAAVHYQSLLPPDPLNDEKANVCKGLGSMAEDHVVVLKGISQVLWKAFGTKGSSEDTSYWGDR